jgi:hypothetical protein
MTARIDSVTRICNQCSAFDKLVASAMAQNGPGFDAEAMKQAMKFMKGGNIKWQQYFQTQKWLGNIYDIRALGRENYNTRYMVYLYALDIYCLYLMSWELPYGITVDDLFAMMTLGWGTNQEKHEFGHHGQK